MDIRALLQQCSAKPVETEIEGLGTVFIRRMTLGEADDMNATPTKNGATHSQPLRLLARFLGDANGAQVFDLSKPDDLRALQGIPVKVAAKILEAGNAVNVAPKGDAEKKD